MYLTRIGLPFTASQIKAIIADIDKDLDGSVDFLEFIKLIYTLSESQKDPTSMRKASAGSCRKLSRKLRNSVFCLCSFW